MTLTNAIIAYETGALISYKTPDLNRMCDELQDKITQINQVVRHEPVAPGVREDLRKYEAIASEIADLLSARNQPATII